MKKNLNKLMITLFLAFASLGSGQAVADEALAESKNCLICHTVENKVVGPAYKEVAAKYKEDDGASAALAGKIKSGGSGVWGNIPMPAQPDLSDEDAQTLADWILTL